MRAQSAAPQTMHVLNTPKTRHLLHTAAQHACGLVEGDVCLDCVGVADLCARDIWDEEVVRLRIHTLRCVNSSTYTLIVWMCTLCSDSGH